MRVNVSLMGDVCFPFPISMTAHDGMSPPPPPVITPLTPYPCIESPTPMMWPPGLALQQNKLTTTVFHKFQFLALDGHDCGYVIPHVTIPPSAKIPFLIMFSGRKVMFSASTVKANGAAVGCASLFSMAMPTPMLCCAWPVSLPIGFPPLNALNTVTVGMTWGDWFAGVIAIVVTMVADALCNLCPFFSEPALGDLASGLLGAGNLQQWAAKAVAGVIAGAAKMILTGEGSIQVGVGSGYAGVQASVGVTQEGGVTAGAQANVATLPVFPGSVQGGYQHTWNPDGTSSNQWTGSAGTPVGVGTVQQTTERDQDGNVTKTTTQTTASGGVAVPGSAVAPMVPGAPLVTGTGAGTYQRTTTEQPGQPTTTTSGGYGGVSSPLGGWGSDL